LRWPGVHALPGQIRHLRLDQVDLPGRRLDPGGLDRPLEEFTAGAVRGYPGLCNRRWPATTSPYLLVTRKIAYTGQPISVFWMNRLFPGLPVTAEQLRDDRIIKEALADRADTRCTWRPSSALAPHRAAQRPGRPRSRPAASGRMTR
jgi:hypothetical protein